MRASVIALTLVLLGAAAAPAAKPRSIYQSPLLWATVNVCDTVDHPNTIGIRASMPGSGYSDETMFVRFQVQYWSTKSSRWHNIGPGGDSGFVEIGSARFKARQTGRNFTVKPPREGQAFIVRGATTYEWRRGDEVIRRARKRTRSGHGRTAGADPVDFSAAKCEIR